MSASPTRRRTLKLVAAAAGLAALPPTVLAAAHGRTFQEISWTGRLMGAESSIRLFHPDRTAGERILQDTLTLVRKQESLFSLYQPQSALRRLNETGRFEDPHPDFVRLLRHARGIGSRTGGKFDVTVQPLWAFYRTHFSDPARTAPPDPARLRAVLDHVDYRKLSIGDDLIRFQRPGMAVTLNGIAQGFVTDRAADHLRRRGLDHVLVDFGEIRALGPQPDGRPWNIALEDPQKPMSLAEILPLRQGAIATSGGYGDPFDATGRFHHLLDPATGASAGHYLALTVEAATALDADSWSTAFYMMSPAEIEKYLTRLPGLRVSFTLTDGTIHRLSSRDLRSFPGR